MAYRYDHPRPALTTDVCVLAVRDGAPAIVLIRRKGEPFVGEWALPGGFVEPEEDVSEGAARELMEETWVAAGPLTLVGVYGRPGRDPRGWTVSVAWRTALLDVAPEARAGDDAGAIGWFALDALPPLAFDHDRIVADARAALGL
ncbi:hypothetical protein BH10PSE2_BH10PSE2_15390 [soil metagenome]